MESILVILSAFFLADLYFSHLKLSLNLKNKFDGENYVL
jgi:hypothetical protein